MNESGKHGLQATERPTAAVAADRQRDAASRRKHDRQEENRWWIRLFIQPALLLACGAIVIIALGLAQRMGFLSAGGGGAPSLATASDKAVRYICPMMCTPPQSEPGRCPVCGMELVPMAPQSDGGNSRSIQIDPVARRIANIQTAEVVSMPITRTVQTIGEIQYDEGSLKTLSAYVDGRLDRLYADYTGVVVTKGDRLALIYSPRLYSGQVELLLAKRAREKSRSASLSRVIESSRNLYESSRQRLIELGMTASQIEQIERAGEANSRMVLSAPISGTVIEKFAAEGQYVKEGQAIYKLADLSTLWLMLQLFPEDAATIRYGQTVEAQLQSLPGRKFHGRVAFIDPQVNATTRTVGVRVVIPNADGLLRVGDYAKATIDVPIGGSGDEQYGIYDPDLANKWISPRHPHVVESTAGKCRICGVDLVPASEFGFTEKPVARGEALVVPRNAVLMAGSNSVLYVETDPGRFELRNVVLGPSINDQIVILSGVHEGEWVATQGNFLIDSQMQLAGNPSLIDPTRAESVTGEVATDEALPPEVVAALAELSVEDRDVAERQRICPVTRMLLGSMGTPMKVDVNGRPVFICCKGCGEALLSDPKKYLARLQAADETGAESKNEIPENLPPLGIPEVVDPESGLPPVAVPQPMDNGVTVDEPAPSHSTKRAAGQRMEGDR